MEALNPPPALTRLNCLLAGTNVGTARQLLRFFARQGAVEPLVAHCIELEFQAVDPTLFFRADSVGLSVLTEYLADLWRPSAAVCLAPFARELAALRRSEVTAEQRTLLYVELLRRVRCAFDEAPPRLLAILANMAQRRNGSVHYQVVIFALLRLLFPYVMSAVRVDDAESLAPKLLSNALKLCHTYDPEAAAGQMAANVDPAALGVPTADLEELLLRRLLSRTPLTFAGMRLDDAHVLLALDEIGQPDDAVGHEVLAGPDSPDRCGLL